MNQSPLGLDLFWAGPYQIMTNDRGTDLRKPFSLSLSLSLLRAALPRGGGKHKKSLLNQTLLGHVCHEVFG